MRYFPVLWPRFSVRDIKSDKRINKHYRRGSALGLIRGINDNVSEMQNFTSFAKLDQVCLRCNQDLMCM